MASLRTLYSGSSGNCTVIYDKDTVILVDMGKSCRRTIKALSEAGINVADISAILITHEHSDHIAGLNTFLKYYPKLLYGSPDTLMYLKDNELIPECDTVDIYPNELINIKDISFKAFRTSHDSVDCYGYRFYFENGRSCSIVTDLGFVNEELIDIMSSSSVVALESNYDRTMLYDGIYPIYLKHRIDSNYGHLSNEMCAKTMVALAEGGTEKFMLMHLSLENNDSNTALTNCMGLLEDYGFDSCEVHVAPRDELSVVLEI